MNRIPVRARLAVVVGGMALALGACSTAKVVADAQISPNLARPAAIYVADFDLPDGAMRSESLLAHLPLHAYRERSQAHALAVAMAQDVTKDLAKKGLSARRLAPGEAPPPQGWLVRGTILQMDEGNRLRRAVIGFGAGHTDLQVAIAVDNLSAGLSPAPLYRMQTGAQSGKSPGAVVTLNPYVAAAKFVLSGHDLGRNTQKTASQIADRVVAHVNETGA